jgi:hypothetical protein
VLARAGCVTASRPVSSAATADKRITLARVRAIVLFFYFIQIIHLNIEHDMDKVLYTGIINGYYWDNSA